MDNCCNCNKECESEYVCSECREIMCYNCWQIMVVYAKVAMINIIVMMKKIFKRGILLKIN